MDLMRDDEKREIDGLVRDENYLGAYLYLKELPVSKADYAAQAGKIVAAVVRDLGRPTTKNDRDRVVYLRSVLVWVFRDIPGLALAYRDQLKITTAGVVDPVSDIVKGFRNIGDVAIGKKSLEEGLEQAAEDVRDNVERTAESIRSGEMDERFKGFFEVAGEGVKRGLDSVGSLFAALNQSLNATPAARSSASTAEGARDAAGSSPDAGRTDHRRTTEAGTNEAGTRGDRTAGGSPAGGNGRASGAAGPVDATEIVVEIVEDTDGEGRADPRPTPGKRR